MTMTKPSNKLEGFDFYHKGLGSSKYVVAPMVDQSEYAWRILSRRYGAQLCYTPMFHAKLFSEHHKYRKQVFSTGEFDRPLIVQFCANDPETLLSAAKLVETQCDAIDLNLGCPQGIAKKGHYGSFLQDEWDLIASMVKAVHEHISVPITCKIRIFPDVKKTIEYALMLQNAGCQLLTVHGRLREQKGQLTGLADWDQIRQVKEALSIPVFANGNILYHDDVERCIKETGVDGVMTAEGNLYNPAIFSGKHLDACDVAQEYLNICKEYPGSSDVGSAKPHLFKMLHMCLSKFPDLRKTLGEAHTFEKLEAFLNQLKSLVKVDKESMDGISVIEAATHGGFKKVPYWLLQPFIRPDASHALNRQREQRENAQLQKKQMGSIATHGSIVEDGNISKGVKRLESDQSTTTSIDLNSNDADGNMAKRTKRGNICISCPNTGSVKCIESMCKSCCRAHLKVNAIYTCEFHRTFSSIQQDCQKLD
ncbi:tRNA dihydrouridine synthase [Batrachochytrium dendrobatidis]|nr:tRNA dihydrouridine synthase [Batrachochytrium dendrobatidis]KAK5670312.1 tRNA dihydrouridine synthase [Batrachochytrium dendrobatidis]